MSRLILLFGLIGLICSTAGAQQRTSQEADSDGALIAFGHDPNCPGCKAFLAGYSGGGSCNCQHTPSCSACDSGAGTGGGAGTGYDAGGGAGGGDDYIAPGEDLLAGDFGAGYGYESAAPGMIGDFFGSGYQMNVVTAGQATGQFTNIPQAGGDRRFKVAENYSPFPVDRVFVNYNHFHSALETADGRVANLNRMTMGVEKTFFDELMSIELRAPFSTGLASDQYVIQNFDNVSGEFGNVAMVLKGLLTQSDTVATAAGVGMVFPTGPDARLFDNRGALAVTIDNEAFYLQPFVGMWWTPNERLFVQTAIQADFDTSGNTIDVLQFGNGPDGTVQDQALLFLDASVGYWIFRDPYSDAFITGLAPMIELHHNTTIEDPDTLIVGGVDSFTNPNGRLDVLNLTGALRFELAGVSYLTLFGVAPLRDNEEKLFDSEFGIQFTQFY